VYKRYGGKLHSILDRFIPRGKRFSIKCVKVSNTRKKFVHLSFLFWTRTAWSSSFSKTPYKQAGFISCAYVLHNAWVVVWRPLLQDWLPVECAYYCRSLANYLIPLQWTSCRIRSIDTISTTQQQVYMSAVSAPKCNSHIRRVRYTLTVYNSLESRPVTLWSEQIPGARYPRRLNFLQCRSLQNETLLLSTFWHLEFSRCA